jgi:hypothetical protein
MFTEPLPNNEMRDNLTEPLPSNDRWDTQTHRLMGGIYKVLRCGDVRCHDMHNKFRKIGSGIQKLIRGIHRHIYSVHIA